MNWGKRYKFSSLEDMTPKSWREEHRIIIDGPKQPASDRTENWTFNYEPQRNHLFQQLKTFGKLVCPPCIEHQHQEMQKSINQLYEDIKSPQPFGPKPELISEDEYRRALENHSRKQEDPRAYMSEFINKFNHNSENCTYCQSGKLPIQNPFE